jgi:ribosomal protein L16 Arg81 hydroxylase
MQSSASALQDFVAPLREDDFTALLQQRKLTLLRGSHAERYRQLLGWQALTGMIERGEHPRQLDRFRLTRESTIVPPERWISKGKIETQKLDAFLAEGFSMVITHLEPYVPPLAAVCAEIGSRLHESSYAGLIVTTGSSGAFKVHYDPEDLLILQVEGTKRWQFFGPAVPIPVRGMPKQAQPDPSPIFDEVLRPGDFLYVPGGNWHHCESGPGRSIHLGIFMTPPTAWHAVRALTSDLLADEMYRTPLTRLAREAELDAVEAELKERLIEKIRGLDLKDFVARWTKKA